MTMTFQEPLFPSDEFESLVEIDFYPLTADSTLTVPLTDLMPNRWNPHKMTSDEMSALIDSIREDGQWRPILVVEMDAPDDTDPEILAKYRIVDGEHAYHALCALALEGGPPYARVMVIGKNSRVPVWKQQLIGQTMNHGLRGSQEDGVKTREVLNEILKHRSPEYIARRIGLGTEGVHQLAGHRLPAAPSKSSKPASIGIKIQSTPYEERKAYITALSFPTPETQKRFDDLMEQVIDQAGIDRDEYSGRRGQLRVDALMKALEDLVQSRGGA